MPVSLERDGQRKDAVLAMNTTESSQDIVSQTEGARLTFFGLATDGIIFTDGQNLFLVWKSNSGECEWCGMQINSPLDGFDIGGYTTVCGAEVDMRRTGENPATENEKNLGDIMANTLNSYFQDEEKRMLKAWEDRCKGVAQ